LSSFKEYLKEDYREEVVRHYIDKRNIAGNIEKGIIFLHEETFSPPEWVDSLNILAEKKSIKVKPKRVSKAILFLTIKGTTKKTFAITFGNGSTLLDTEYIVRDFGLKVSKSLLTIREIIAIDSTSIDRKIFNTKKQSASFLMPERLFEFGTQNIIKNVHGVFKEFNKKFSLGGNESLHFKGDINLLQDIEKWLTQFADLYSAGENTLGLSDDLVIADTKTRKILDEKLGEKILKIINANPITGRQVTPLKISPNVIFDLTTFNGFFITGLGYKNLAVSSDFFIDEVDFFERLSRKLNPNKRNKEDILSKIKTTQINQKDEQGELTSVCSVYKAINFEMMHGSNQYILVSGIWYQIDKDFYSRLQKDIDAIESPDHDNSINFINFDGKKHVKIVTKDGKPKTQKSEGKYNEDLAGVNHILMLDRQDYRVDIKTMKKYGLKTQSSIEICDVIYFDKKRYNLYTLKDIRVLRELVIF
jgi:uncharacterized protein (TIGR04141 family)